MQVMRDLKTSLSKENIDEGGHLAKPRAGWPSMDLSQNSQIRGKNVPCCDIVKQMTQWTHDWAIVLYENFRIWLTLISEMGVVPCFLFNRRHRI